MPGTKPLRTHSCQTCGEQPARYYFLGYRCVTHAPTEAQAREHATARARDRDALRERAVSRPLDRETR